MTSYFIISKPEGKMKLLHPSVEFVLLCILLDWSKMGENTHKVFEVHLLLLLTSTLEEESVDNPVSKRIDGQLRDPEKVLSAEITFVLFV